MNDGKVVDVFPEAFELRTNESYLSAIYFEFFAGDDLAKMQSCLSALQFPAAPNDGMMKMNVGEIVKAGAERSRRLQAFHDGSARCPPYASLRGMPTGVNQDRELMTRLAEIARSGTLQVKKLW